ncbi:MAG: hypothetical protein E7647_06210 [Ruminococcaceae bacterium]|nr:hypothetical protein [Oscillospiraceae bacterium]
MNLRLCRCRERIWDVVEEFINKIRGAISSLYGESTALHDEARFMELYADELQKVFDKALSDALNASEATVDHSLQSNANKKTPEDGGKVQKSAAEKYTEYDKPITVSDIETLRSIGRKSINDFTSEDIQKAQKWPYKFYKTDKLGVKSPFFRAWFGDWRAYDGPVSIDGKNGIAKLYVTEEIGDINKFYLVKIEMVSTDSTVSGNKATTPNSSVNTEISISEIYRFVKEHNDDFEDDRTSFKPKPVEKVLLNGD